MSKILLFSHKSDIDGMGSVILSKLAFDDIEYILCDNPEDLELTFRDLYNKNYFDKYDKIYITDLSLGKPSIDIVDKSDLKNKILIFDHHQGAISKGLDKYSFSTITEVDKNGVKTCGTELYYKYLLNNNLLRQNKYIDEFVKLTRLEDTWVWEKNGLLGIKAHDLAIYFTIIGLEKYIEIIYNKLKNNSIDFTNEEIKLIEDKKSKIISKIKSLLKDAESFVDEFNNKYIICYADYEFRNDLSNYIIKNNNADYKYVIVVAFDKGLYGQKSYRGIDEKIDVNKIAMLHGGGGHHSAAAVSITKEQKEHALELNKRDGLKYLANSIYKE